MPWIAIYEGKKVGPHQVPIKTDSECPRCGGRLRVRRRSKDGRARHFVHIGNVGGGSGNGRQTECSPVGESEIHKKLKNLALSGLLNIFENGIESYGIESGSFDAPLSGKEHRKPDAHIKFQDEHEVLGEGVVVEVQYKNESKDIDTTTKDFVEQNYSILWLGTDDFLKDRLRLSKADVFKKAREAVWPDLVPVKSDWGCSGGSDRAQPYHSISPLMGWQFTNNAKELRSGNLRQPMMSKRVEELWGHKIESPEITVRLPREFYEQRLWEGYPWDRHFDDNGFTQQQLVKIGQSNGGGPIQEIEASFDIPRWLADRHFGVVVAETPKDLENLEMYAHQIWSINDNLIGFITHFMRLIGEDRFSIKKGEPFEIKDVDWGIAGEPTRLPIRSDVNYSSELNSTNIELEDPITPTEFYMTEDSLYRYCIPDLWDGLFDPPEDFTDIWCYSKVPATFPDDWLYNSSDWDSLFDNPRPTAQAHEDIFLFDTTAFRINNPIKANIPPLWFTDSSTKAGRDMNEELKTSWRSGKLKKHTQTTQTTASIARTCPQSNHEWHKTNGLVLCAHCGISVQTATDWLGQDVRIPL